MKIAFTMPGRHGDILWSLPSARALAETYDTPVDLVISPKYGSLAELLRLQPYLASVSIDPAWEVREEAPMQPRIPPTPIGADLVVHGGYAGWPTLPLPDMIELTVRRQVPIDPHMRQIDLARPWITISGPYPPTDIAVGFSDEWFELKLGLVLASLSDGYRPYVCLVPRGSRWDRETRYVSRHACGWAEAAGIIRNADCFLGCCSALHVLAVGLGKPCVIVEPSEMRWNPIFWPLGMDGPQVTCVKGGDGRPTFDARHVADTLKRVLGTVRTGGTL